MSRRRRCPAWGLRYDFATAEGQRIAVVSRRTGKQELVLYAQDDPDRAEIVIPLTATEADTLAEILGAPRIVERLSDLHRQVEELIVEQVLGPRDRSTRGGHWGTPELEPGRAHRSLRWCEARRSPPPRDPTSSCASATY